MTIQKRVLRLALIILLSVAVFLVVSLGVLSYYAQQKAEAALKSSNVNVSAIHVNLFTRSIVVNDLEWTYSVDSLSGVPHHFQAQIIQIKGIGLYQLLLHKKLRINKLYVEGGTINYNHKPGHKALKSTHKEIGVEDISIGVITLKDIHTNLFYDTIPEYAGVVNLTLSDTKLTDIKHASDLSRYILKSIEGNITQIRLHENGSMYTTTISQLYINSAKNQVSIDSLYLIPMYSKYDFSRKVGKQIDRFSAYFPKYRSQD